jgi:hypothetical protein
MMRLRLTRAAAASSVIAIGAVLLAGAVPAFANQQDGFYILSENGGNNKYWLVNDGGLATVNQPIEGGDTFENINGTTWNSRPVYEWWDEAASPDVKECLTSEGSAATVKILPCKVGDEAQLWWSNKGEFVNEATTGSGSSQCLNADHATDGSDVDVLGCKTDLQVGWFDQYWNSLGT